MQIKDKAQRVTDLAFVACDNDNSNSLDQEELSAVMKEVAHIMKITPPTKDDITSVLEQLDENNDFTVSKDEFYQLIILVLGKMLESEQELQDKKDEVVSGISNI